MPSLRPEDTETVTPLTDVPCANHDPRPCTSDVLYVCGGCRLVSYCSKECQKKHWRVHKPDCKHKLRSDKWRTAASIEDRVPTSPPPLGATPNPGPPVPNPPGFPSQPSLANFKITDRHMWHPLSHADILNLPMNEGVDDLSRDFNLAFVGYDALGLVKTVNALPAEYRGHLNVVLTPLETSYVARFLIMLLFLGAEEDAFIAAELAIHYHCSAFLPQALYDKGSALLMSLYPALSQSSYSIAFGERATMKGMLGDAAKMYLLLICGAEKLFTAAGAKRVRDQTISNPIYRDQIDEDYYNMEPSHRLAIDKFRRTGVLLPFGASVTAYKEPNLTLFNPYGTWMPPTRSLPIDPFDKAEVIEAGTRHNAPREDIFGCLYFYLHEQFQEFASRLRRFHITIHLSDTLIPDVPGKIRSGGFAPIGIPKEIVFDRINVFELCDPSMITIPPILSAWGPLLNKGNPHATLLGVLTNWSLLERGSSSTREGDGIFEQAFALSDKLLEYSNKGWVRSCMDPAWLDISNIMSCTGILAVTDDNSAAWKRYLQRPEVRATASARKVGLKMKGIHTVVPPRLFVPVNAAVDDTPTFVDKDDFYCKIMMKGSIPVKARFVEFRPA